MGFLLFGMLFSHMDTTTHVDESKESGHLMHSFLFLLSEQSSFFFPAHHTHLNFTCLKETSNIQLQEI